MDEKMKKLTVDMIEWLLEQRRGKVDYVSLETLQCEFVGDNVTELDVHYAWCHIINAAETLTGVIA